MFAHRITSLAVGLNHNAAMSVAGDVYVWGQNKHGCLGVGDTVNRDLPTKVCAQVMHSCHCLFDNEVLKC